MGPWKFGTFHIWAKMGPFWAPGDPEGTQYQVKVSGDHESNPGRTMGGTWDQIWLSKAHRGPLGPQKGGNWLLFHSSDLVREGFWSSNIVILI